MPEYSGLDSNLTPRAGAVAQTDRGGLGHVAIVQEVSADGTQIKYSDMNGLAGWGRVGYSDWVSASHFEHYIVHTMRHPSRGFLHRCLKITLNSGCYLNTFVQLVSF
jgi:surface antigen